MPLVLDLSSHSICNVGLGDPVEWLSALGPPEDPEEVRRECYLYYSKGIQIEAEGGLICAIIVTWFDDLHKRFNAFAGHFTYQGRELDVSPDISEESFVRFFCEPYHRDEDEREILLFFEIRPDVEWPVEFTRKGSLKAMIITSEPLLGDGSQRAA